MANLGSGPAELTIRVVYDGAPEAGKTTNVHTLRESISLQRRGKLESPGTDGRATQFFDWLDFTGGVVDGRRVHCQLITVPGQENLAHRRRYLLEQADAVVFVVDSTEQGVRLAKEQLLATRRMLDDATTPLPIRLLIQANKQDNPDALDVETLASALGVQDGETIVPSVASSGDGVMQTLILAVRLATDRVRALMLAGRDPGTRHAQVTPGTLHEALVALETSIDSGERADAEDELSGLSVSAGEQSGVRPLGKSASRHDIWRPNQPSLASKDLVAASLEVEAGNVWPPVKGRALLGELDPGTVHVPAAVQAWAPRDAVELQTRDWYVHSSSAWRFEQRDLAKATLMRLVRWHLRYETVVTRERAIFLSRQEQGTRLWMVTRRLETLRHSFTAAVRERDAARVDWLWAQAKEFTQLHAEIAGADDERIAGGLDAIVVDSDGVKLAAVDGAEGGSELRNLQDELLELREGLSAQRPDLSGWIAGLRLA